MRMTTVTTLAGRAFVKRQLAERSPGRLGSRRRASRRRSGVKLVELMITLVLLGIVAGGMMQIIVKQQKFYTGSSGVLGTRSNVRQGVAVLQSDLRAIRPERDIYAGEMKATSLAFREPRGSSVICAVDGAHTTIVVPPPVLSNDVGYTSWLQPPAPGDSVLVYDMGARAWIDGAGVGNYITGSQPTEGSGLCTGLVPLLDVARGWQITLANPLPDTVGVGSSLRFFRSARYELMQATDGDWYLGYYDCNPLASPQCGALSPISGPYLSKDNDPPGLNFSYFDASGAATTDPASLRRIDITLRSQSSSAIDIAGHAKGFYKDSLSTSIAVRNFQ